ncbi:MAG: hypothetical protein MZW92_70870 [Comamonadaceae bacterium]|nr:hypothetical protein [Comamonadaceae bacterium]
MPRPASTTARRSSAATRNARDRAPTRTQPSGATEAPHFAGRRGRRPGRWRRT